MNEDSTRIRIRISNDAMKLVEEQQRDTELSLSTIVELCILNALGGEPYDNKNK